MKPAVAITLIIAGVVVALLLTRLMEHGADSVNIEGRLEDRPSLAPAPTPTDAMKQWWQAIADGDQKAFSERVIIRSKAGYCNAFADFQFASARLHQVVLANKVGRDDAKDDRGRFLSPGLAPHPPTARIVPGMVSDIEKVQWKIDGTSAAQVDSKLSSGEWGNVSAECAGDGWVIVLSDPDALASEKDFQRFVTELKATTAAVNTAIDKVLSGDFTTVRQINDFLDARFADVKAKEKA